MILESDINIKQQLYDVKQLKVEIENMLYNINVN